MMMLGLRSKFICFIVIGIFNFIKCFKIIPLKSFSNKKLKIEISKLSIESIPQQLQVTGSEGLLDPSRMDRAFKGSGINVPSDKKLRIGIIGSGLSGMITAMELSDAGHDVEIFESRRFYGGKVGSWVDKSGNHVEMGLHVFFGCYYNLFGIMKRIGAFKNLRLKEHTHTFINTGGRVASLDFRLGGIGMKWSNYNLNFLKLFHIRCSI